MNIIVKDKSFINIKMYKLKQKKKKTIFAPLLYITFVI